MEEETSDRSGMGGNDMGSVNNSLTTSGGMTSSSISQTVCAVCLDGFREGEVVRELPCGHEFHMECIDGWLQRQCDRGVMPSCPLDRMRVV